VSIILGYPLFPEEGSLDEEVWEQARKNVEKA
jgi:hypothetical protein